jgi:Tol biopolymer transport system component
MKPIKKVIFSFSSILLIILSGCSDDNVTDPDPIDYHNKILFTSFRSDEPQLYMIDPDGTNMIQITSVPYWHNDGRWSPDAQKIVCNTEQGSSTAGMEMVVMDSDGSNRKLLGWGNQMSWHPDGNSIIYSYWQGAEVGIENNKLFSVKPNGENRQVLSEDYVGNHSFSPDGTQIAFPFNQDSLKGIVILDYPEFNNPVYISLGTQIGRDPCWSPDGIEIVFSYKENSTELNSIYIMNSDGTNIRRIIYNNSDLHYYSPRFSPDCFKIIFLGHALDGTARSYLYIVNEDGTDLHKVIDDDYVTSCDWSR